MKIRPLTSLFVCLALLSASCIASAQSVTIFTDRSAWESAAATLSPSFLMHQDFNSLTPGTLSTGQNEFWTNDPAGFFIVDIIGSPGFNSIEDGTINPEMAFSLSPNGSTFYLGEVSGTTKPQFLFQPFAAPPISFGFGADWVVLEPGLNMEIGGITIDFDTYLPSGFGFLGIITADVITAVNPVLFNTSNPSQVFGMDNIVSVATPVPPAVWLFSSGLLGLIGIARRKKSA